MNKINPSTHLFSPLIIIILGCLLSACSLGPTRPTLSSSNSDGTYGGIQRGSYQGSYYKVQKGDTLYFISYLTSQDVKSLISYNNLQPPYTIKPGQKIKLWGPKYVPPAYGYKGRSSDSGTVTYPLKTKIYNDTPAKVNPTSSASATPKSTPLETEKKKSQIKTVEQTKNKGYIAVNKKETNLKHSQPIPPKPKEGEALKKVDSWLWPTKGRVIAKFSLGDQGNKGIDIAGQRGQDIISTASGQVVYAGNALRGYGNLIIVKHNEDYLSAYAHNEELLVKEGQTVKAGQKIASMGSSSTSSVRLHFEIRFRGKSVNPQRYLP